MACLSWLSWLGAWLGSGRSHSQLSKQAPHRIGLCTRCGPQSDLPLRVPARSCRNERLLGSGNKVVTIFCGAHVCRGIYGDHAGHYGIMQMVDDTCVWAHMRASTAPIIGMWN